MKRSLLFWVALAALSLSSTVHAAEWNFYGSARVSTFWTDVENNGTSTTNFAQALQGNSRIGANVKVSDTLAGRFEYGASGGNANLRHLYGEWNFGPGKLLVGQTDSPLNFAFSGQVYGTDSGMDPYGGVDAKRQPMLQLTFGSFKIAAIEQDISVLGLASSTSESKLPKLEASYRLDLNNAFLQVAGGYQTYEFTDTATSTTYDVDSYILAVGGQVRFGAAYIGGDIWFGQNVGPYNYSFDPDGDPKIVSNTLIDNEAYGMMAAAGFTLNPTFSFEAGIGYTAGEPDHANYQEDDTVAYYVQSTITLAPGVIVVPEIGRIDKDKSNTGTAEDDTVYAGMKWQVNF